MARFERKNSSLHNSQSYSKDLRHFFPVPALGTLTPVDEKGKEALLESDRGDNPIKEGVQSACVKHRAFKKREKLASDSMLPYAIESRTMSMHTDDLLPLLEKELGSYPLWRLEEVNQ